MQKIVLKNITLRQSWPWLIAAALLILLLVFIFSKPSVPKETVIEKYLKHQSDSLLRENIASKKREARSQEIIDSLEQVTQFNDTKIKTIYVNVEKKVMVFDTFTVEQLERVISERYK